MEKLSLEPKDPTEVLSFSKLRSFVTIAEYESFSKAAESLYLSQSALSRQITSLEEELGVTLFFRSNRFVRLSPAGQTLYDEAKEILTRIKQIVENVRAADQGARGQLKIGYTGIEKSILPIAVRTFHQQYPDIQISFLHSPENSLHEALLHGTVDVGFVPDFVSQRFADISTRLIFTDRQCFVFSKDHSLAKKDQVSFADLAHERLLCFSASDNSSAHNDFQELCLRHSICPVIDASASDEETLLLQVKAGLGVAIMSQSTAQMNSHSLVFFPITDADACRGVYIAWRTQNHNPCLELFVETVSALTQQ